MPYKNKEKQKEFQKRNYQNNKKKYRENLKQLRARNKDFVYSMKTSCVYCGMDDKVCLDFHHLTDKVKCVSQLIRDATTIEKLKLEISKCEVVCGNCHKKIHSPEELKESHQCKNNSKSFAEKRKWYIDFIKTCFCVDCGEKDRRCLQFHHLKDKITRISNLVCSKHSLEFLKLEIAKCVVVCVNCHRKRHN